MKRVKRIEDMSTCGFLCLIQQYGGDIIVACTNSLGETTDVEFCAPGAGGGRSPNTLKALYNLIQAIEQDNEEKPIK